jgi:hypothetical protein
MTVRTDVGERIYRGFLRLYPPEFRDRFTEEMVQLFHDKLRDARTGGVSGGTVSAWFRLLGDVVSTAPSEHLRRSRTVAHSLTSAPPLSARALGAAGILAGLLALVVYVLEIPQDWFVWRIILLNLGSIALILAVHRRQASTAPALALLGAIPAVLANAWYLGMAILSMVRSGPIFGGTFGVVMFWAGVALWLTTAFFGVVTLRLGAVTRWGALATAVGALLTLTGIDRLGLVSEASPTIFNTLSQVGIGTMAIGWILLGLDVALRRLPQPTRSSGVNPRT